MKLIDDFARRLDAGNLPERFTDWWVIEDADRDFLEHPFDKDHDHDWMAMPPPLLLGLGAIYGGELQSLWIYQN